MTWKTLHLLDLIPYCRITASSKPDQGEMAAERDR